MAKYMDVQHGFSGVPEDQLGEAHERDLAAEERRRAFRARLHRQRTGTSGTPRSPLRWLPAWLRPGRGGIMRLPRPGVEDKRVVLRDGSQVLIRQVQSADGPLLADGFARLSTKSRQMRFLTPKKELSPSELRYLTDIDHHDHEALGALSHPEGQGVGIARYIRNAEDLQAADIAVTIVDDWQGRGLGTELLTQLSDRARQEGIRRFIALVAADNAAIIGLLRNASADLVRREFGTLEYEIPLEPAEEHDLSWPDLGAPDEAREEYDPAAFDLAPAPLTFRQ
jgi:RimJ/RimL family protein N-acetyltransferase